MRGRGHSALASKSYVGCSPVRGCPPASGSHSESPNAPVSAATKSSGGRRAATMEESKKRKFEEDSMNGGVSYLDSASQLRFLLDPLRKDQLVDLLVKLGNQYPSVAEEIRGLARSDPVHRKLFVRGLSWDTTSETLCAVFSVHGEIEEGAVIVDKATGKSRGYGFITYKHMASTIRALQEPSKLIDGRLAVCNLACDGLNSTSGSGDLALRKIYIGGLSPNISSEILLNFFGRYGEIEEGSVAYDKETNRSRGFGFVTYKTVEGAKKAIDDPIKTLGGRSITVKLADAPRSKVIQAQVPTAVVPMPIPVPIGYASTGKAQVGGYALYQPIMAAYPTAYASTQFATAAQVSHPQTWKREQVVVPAIESNGVTGYQFM